MPVIKSAKKKLKQDKKRTAQNQNVRSLLTRLLKKAKKTPSENSVQEAFKIADKAAKQHIIHKNKASRIKSALSKLLKPASGKQTTSVEKKRPGKSPRQKTKAPSKK